ncbi:MAG: SpoIIE family protein phosphatase [Candidatus Riflebacteria bacterium]|nr:SpoIIE family protein phosphatase [Candidatus Riflebacteria bacterium]
MSLLAKRYFSWILTCIVFFISPGVLFFWGMEKRWNSLENQMINDKFDQLDDILMALKRDDVPKTFFSRIICEIFSQAKKSPDPVLFLETAIPQLKRNFPGLFTVVAVDGQGNLIRKICDDHPPRELWKKWFFAQNSLPDNNSFDEEKKANNLLEENWSAFKMLLGEQALIFDFTFKRTFFISVSSQEKKRWFISLCNPKIGLFIHLSQKPDLSLIVAQTLIKKFNRKLINSYFRVGIIQQSALLKSGSKKNAYLSFLETNNPHQISQRNLFSFINFSPLVQMYACVSLKKNELYLNNRRVLITFLSLITLILTIVSYQMIVLEITFPISVKTRLVLLFSFAAGLPVAILALSGWDYIHQQKNVLEQDFYRNSEKALTNFDAGFPKMIGQIQYVFKGIAKELDLSSEKSQEIAFQKLSSLGNRFSKADLFISDRKGKIIWSNRPNIQKYDRQRKYLGNLSIGMLAEINKEEPPKVSAVMDEMLGAISGEKISISQLLSNIGEFFETAFGVNKYLYCFHPLFDHSKTATHMLAIIFSKGGLETSFIRTNLPKLEATHYPICFFANPKTYFEPYGGETNSLGLMWAKTRIRQNTTFGKSRYKNEEYLVTGIRPKEMAGKLLFAYRKSDYIQKELSRINILLSVLIVLCFSMALFFGNIISQRFLKPVRQFEIAIEALQKREFSYRLPPGDADEFGALALTFNRMFEGLGDLEIAKIVQENLFPKKKIQSECFSIFGASCPANQLGGDFFDYKVLPDGKILIVIGDVAGHGVHAALGMTMTKALLESKTAHDLELGKKIQPIDLLKSLHNILYEKIMVNEMISILIMIADPNCSQAVFVNSGHCFPFFYKAGTAPVMIQNLSSRPLGTWGKREKDKLKEFSLEIQPDDNIVFYTDGLIEARNNNNDFFGFDQTIENLKPLISDDPCDTYQKITKWRLENSKPPQEDDITIVVLHCHKHSETS